jgi:hypothetical protein
MLKMANEKAKMEAYMFVSIRKYVGCKDVHEVNRRVVENLIPTLRGFPGFQSYSIIDLGGGSAASISVFDTQDHAESATERVRSVVREHLVDLLPNPPEVTIGELLSEHRK